MVIRQIGVDGLQGLCELLRFASTTHEGLNSSFADYKARMKEGQEAIYYITADTLAAAKTDRKFNRMRPSMARVLGLETRSAKEG